MRETSEYRVHMDAQQNQELLRVDEDETIDIALKGCRSLHP